MSKNYAQSKKNTPEDKILTLEKNLRFLLKAHSISESEIAHSLDIPVMTIRRLVSGETADPRISTLKQIADFFNITIDCLIKDNNFQAVNLMQKTTPQFIPIFNWELIGQTKSIKNINLQNWEQWHPVTLGDHTTLSNDAFGLESRPSMLPRFPTGTLFIIDPNESPTDGDIVLVKIKSDRSVSLRELNIDASKWHLQPIVCGSEMFFYDKALHGIIGVVMLTLLHTKK